MCMYRYIFQTYIHIYIYLYVYLLVYLCIMGLSIRSHVADLEVMGRKSLM